ncbi:sugar phosphate isomerase/epimerase, partial [Micromonospora sp. M51]
MDQQLNTPASEPVSRRGVLRAATVSAAAVGAAGLLAGPATAAPGASGAQAQGRRRVPVDRISIQLYTLRDQLAIDLPGTLDALRRIGYRRVEHAGFVGRTAAQFRAALDDAGLRSTSGHVGIPQPFDAATWEQALADANVVGCKKIVHPYFGRDAAGQPIRDPAVYRALARDLNKAGRLAERAGLEFGYHNHQLEFVPLTGGSTGFDILSSQTDPRLVHFELDLYWTW